MHLPAPVVVVLWYSITLTFNYTAFLLVQLKDDLGKDATTGAKLKLAAGDITVIEMFACTVCGALTLYSQSLQFLPPSGARRRMLLVAVSNAAACRLFMMAMDEIKLSLIQTIRACQPLVTVVVVYFLLSESYSAQTYATLVPITVGFILAAGGDPEFEEFGFMLAFVSMCFLVMVNTGSRMLLKDPSLKDVVQPIQVQAWTTAGSFFLLVILWAGVEGGIPRLAAVLSGPKSTDLCSLVLLNGVMYHLANVGTFTSIARFDGLSFAVIDTIRRLLVVVSGFVVQGNPCTAKNLVGIGMVFVGAGTYNIVKGRQAYEPSKAKKTT